MNSKHCEHHMNKVLPLLIISSAFIIRELPFVSKALCYDRFLYPPPILCMAVKKPGKFMWKCKQLLCISFAILLPSQRAFSIRLQSNRIGLRKEWENEDV
ncbi:CLUMA_CG006732, isoform A [Clunio marinus]|uniref:CLUMA_CG006732, isoform A n=1 Tax=Clunio marinus TaxID=568069 RepID=A0A1J1I0S9_9DIPT|nr:CLUMA_CG006732, isoform A [Clunio marinus]